MESLDFILGAGHGCRELSLAVSGWHMGLQLVLIGVPGWWFLWSLLLVQHVSALRSFCSQRDVSEPELPGRHRKEPGPLLMSLGPSLHLFPLAWTIGTLSPTSASGPKPKFKVTISNHKAKAIPVCNSHPDPRTSHTLDLIL